MHSQTLPNLAPQSAHLMNPLWQMLFYEAVRGNHSLLFSDDQIRLRAVGTDYVREASAEDKEQLADWFAAIMLETQLETAKSMLLARTTQQRGALFLLYLRHIQRLGQQLRDSIN